MNEDDYVTMSEDYKINEDDYRRTPSLFYNWNEMIGSDGVVIQKEDIAWNDISGDPKDMKHIRKTRTLQTEDTYGNSDGRYNNNNIKEFPNDYSQEEDFKSSRRQVRPQQAIQRQYQQNIPLSQQEEKCSSSYCNLRPVIDFTNCPICSEKWIKSCNCTNHDSMCKNGHKWHVSGNKIKLGHSH